MTLVKNTLFKALVLIAAALLLTAVTSQVARAQAKYSDYDPQGQQALEVIAKDLQITTTSALDKPSIEANFSKDGRDYYQLLFTHSVMKNIRILISGPQGFLANNKKYPVLFMSAGFFSGMASVALVENPGDMILVGFEYPSNMDMIKKDPSLLFKTIRLVPGQIALTLEWLKSQTWASDKLSVMGVSLGSLFMPVSLRLAELRGVTTTSTIFAFGGAHILPVVEQKLVAEGMSPLATKLTVKLIGNMTSLHDPKIHLSSLTGPFMTIYGDQDEVFSRETSLMQYDLLQGQKEIHWVHGQHIDTNRPDIIQETMTKAKEFLDRVNQ